MVETDLWGNIVASRSGTQPDAPGIAFVAHMDHPGFEAIRMDGDRVVCRALGGVPAAGLEAGVPVIFLQAAARGSGQRSRTTPVKGRTAGRTGEPDERLVMVAPEKRLVNLPCPVIFDLPDFDLDAEMIRMRALDDLAGCAAIMAALRSVASTQTPGTVYGLFTRAEEVGLVGARLAAEDGLLPRNVVVVSVESSRTLPGAEIGRGPVIRVGDAMSTFDNRAEMYLLSARDRLAERHGSFDSQRQLMRGGTCEASAFGAFGYPVTGLAFPLGNYHNDGPENTIAAEYIALNDFAGGAELLAEAAALAGTSPTSRSIARIRQRPVEEAKRLAPPKDD